MAYCALHRDTFSDTDKCPHCQEDLPLDEDEKSDDISVSCPRCGDSALESRWTPEAARMLRGGTVGT